MSKTVTLRLSDEVYLKFLAYAKAENRSLSNLIETMALRKAEEEMLVGSIETEEIQTNERLLKKLQEGSRQARQTQGRFVE